ncbi:MAG: hypothetical protein HY908_02005 [Myxococcales bacterium]|nr:hypothetical protein [Myxococcales bacterium]
MPQAHAAGPLSVRALVAALAPLPAVALGCLLFAVHGAPPAILATQLVAGALGLAACAALARMPDLVRRGGAFVLLATVALVAATLAAPGIDDTHRWLRVGPLWMHAGAALEPGALVVLALLWTEGSRALVLAGALVAGALHVAQPDAGQATALAAGLVMLALVGERGSARPETEAAEATQEMVEATQAPAEAMQAAPVEATKATRAPVEATAATPLALVVAAERRARRHRALRALLALLGGGGLVAALARPDTVPSQPLVEGIVGRAALHGTEVAALAVAALALVPLGAAWLALDRARPRPARHAAACLAAYFAGALVAPILGAYPVPWLGAGASPIVGGYAALGLVVALGRERASRA